MESRQTCKKSAFATTFWTSTDVLQNAQVVLENGQHTEECRARIEQALVDKGDATKLETSGNQEDTVP